MFKRNLITFFCHIAIIVITGILLNLSHYFGSFDKYFELIVTLAACLAYYFLGTILKNAADNNTNYLSTFITTFISVTLWIMSFTLAILQGPDKIFTIDDLPFRSYGLYLSFNSPFIPLVDMLTSHTIVYGWLFGFLLSIIAFVPQALILLGMMWDKRLVKRRFLITVYITGIISLVLVISNILCDTYDINKNNIAGNTSGNLSNEGQMCIQGSWIYNNRSKRFYPFSVHRLYKTKINGRYDIALYNHSATNLNVIGNSIYFIDEFEGNKCYSIKTEGGQRTLISDDRISYMLVYGSYIYYKNESDGRKLYRMDLSGNSKTKLSDDEASSIYVHDDYIYYSNQNNIYKMKIDGMEKQCIYKGNISLFIMENGVGFFLDANKSNSLMKIDLNTARVDNLNVSNLHKFNVINNSILFTYTNAANKDPNVCFISFNGKAQGYEKVNGNYFYNIKNKVFLYDDFSIGS